MGTGQDRNPDQQGSIFIVFFFCISVRVCMCETYIERDNKREEREHEVK